jgi:cytochrome c peroxidase
MFRPHFSRHFTGSLAFIAAASLIALAAVHSAQRLYGEDGNNNRRGNDDRNEKAAGPAASAALQKVKLGRQTFRFDTFGDESFWGDALKLHQAIEGSRLGGVGDGVSPAAALSLGLKVDVDALPGRLLYALKSGTVDLHDPATTVSLLKLNAVVGVTGIFKGNELTSFGIQCALCHSTVDDSFAPGIGHRLDGWANRDLNVGAIIAAAPDLSAIEKVLDADEQTVRNVLTHWGPGKFDAELFLDGKGFRPDGRTAATLIPPAFGLGGVNLHTWTGWGSVPYWNAFVAVLEMHGKGRFFDPRLNDPVQFPVAARNNFGNVEIDPDDDRVTPKLSALQAYQLSIPSPLPPRGSFSRDAAERGDALFSGKAKCNTCHSEPLWTEPGWNLHTPAEVCVDDFQANRAPDHRYRTAPLGALFTHQKGGFYHDGRFATLGDVVNHYDSCMALGLTDSEKNDLVQYLLSLQFDTAEK